MKRMKMLPLKFSSKAITWWKKVERQNSNVITHRTEAVILYIHAKVSINRAIGKVLEDIMNSISYTKN